MTFRTLINYFLPGSILFLIVGLALGVVMLYGRDRLRRLGRIWLTLLALFYLVASTDAGAGLMLKPLYRHTDYIKDAAAAQGATAIVLLNAGANTYSARGRQLPGMAQAAALRLLETARVYRLLGNPIVIVQGGFSEQTDRPSLGAIYSKALVDLGIPPDRIVVEPNSRNTREHVENLKPYLEKYKVQKFVLVTSPEHMWRSSVAFRHGGYDFVPSAAAADSDLKDIEESPLFPSNDNLDRVVWGTHEYLGLLMYWWNGWLK